MLTILVLASSVAAIGAVPAITRITPPERGFYARRLDYHGIPIKAAEVVDDAALRAAYQRLAMMLDHMANARENLAAEGVELHIIGRSQGTSDLPENRHWKGKPYDGNLDIDQRTRGVGGQYTSCGEENLLHLPGDRYADRDICVHEFAHALFSYGLSGGVRERIQGQYRRSTERGLWKTAYAATNVDEFFAELTMWYFGTRGDLGKMSPAPERGREGLRGYDPEACALLDDLYAGRIPVERLRLVRLKARTPGRTAPASPPDSIATSIRFRNATERDLEYHWLDEQGKRHLYGTLAPGEQRAQGTFAGHLWLVTDTTGHPVAIYTAQASPGLAVVRDTVKR